MSVRVVARIRPLLKSENDKDVIVHRHDGQDADTESSIIKIPNLKNAAEEYSFQFNSVYGPEASQQEIFDAEVTPTIKHLFAGYDVTLFAYGSTGTGKTFTMRGGKSLADRGMIPRLLSGIFRKGRALEKSSNQTTEVKVTMSYYEIYNDKVFDLFEASAERSATGLPIREAEGGKTVVVGLSEVPCASLKDFEELYDAANKNRSTGATKLNAHSSRSHAVLCVKVSMANTTTGETRLCTASAIDLAGSEDNRRTGNGKDRMVESASINKSLFVLAQCVEAISKKQSRIPYRESKMTRILSLGQNNGFTIMILNLAPVKSYHLDTLSSLNFANRTKKIEVREVENEVVFRGPPRMVAGGMGSLSGPTMQQRQPLRPLMNGANVDLGAGKRDAAANADGKPMKAFAVYSDKHKATTSTIPPRPSTALRSPLKRTADSSFMSSSRPNKTMRPTPSFIRRAPERPTLTKQSIESLVEAKVSEILAARALNAPVAPPTKELSEEVQRRLDSIEQRLEGQDGERAEGLSYLFMAKQHQARGEDGSALRMYLLARPFFPENEKLGRKIESLRAKTEGKSMDGPVRREGDGGRRAASRPERDADGDGDESYHDNGDDGDYGEDGDGDESFHAARSRKQKHAAKNTASRRARVSSPDPLGRGDETAEAETTPRTRHLLHIINSRDVGRMTALNGLGAKRAEGIVACLREMDEKLGFAGADGQDGGRWEVGSWRQLGGLRGIGSKTLEAMRAGCSV